jgi:hypothetical protein
LSAIRFWLVLVLGAAVPSIAAAQAPETRAGEIEQRQQEKAARVRPHTRNFFERRLLDIEQTGGFAVRRGFFVTFGDIKQGSSIALGPAYGRLFENGTIVAGKATYSIRNFKLLQVSAASPRLAGGRLQVQSRARWQDAPELAVYALGTDSPKTRADYAETRTEVSAEAELRPVSFIRLGAGAAYERYETGPADTGRSSVEEIFTPAEMPGIDADPRYLHSFVSGGIDTRPAPGYSRSGSLLHAALHDYRQQNDGPYSFRRLDAIARQLIPILHGNWVIDLSVRTSTTSVDDGQQVPFFLMPDLGGGSELRGYSSYRFRDRHSIVFTGEYRWYVQEFVDMAVFYDAGKVAARRGDLDFDDLKSNVGLGIRFHSPLNTALRLEVAKGSEGFHFIFAFSAPVR